MRRPRPAPPRPSLVRRPTGSFGWLDARLLHDGWLARLGPGASAVLVLLALAADRHGASFYGRRRMADALAMDRGAVDRALAKLVQAGLVDHRPWRSGQADGVWQLIPLPVPQARPSTGPTVIGDILKSLGVPMPERMTS